MKLSVKGAAYGMMVAGMVLSTASVAAEASAGRNTGSPPKGGVGVLASGVSGYAVVNADGTLARKSNAKSVDHTPGSNDYTVHFNSNIRGCAYTATIGLSGSSGTSSPGQITVVGAAVDTKAVFVSTTDAAGVDAERGFHLLVTCA